MEPCSRYNRMLDSVKSDYFKAKIHQAGNHKLFKTVEQLFTSGSPVLPTINDSLESSPENFNDFHVQRIRNLRNDVMGNF